MALQVTNNSPVNRPRMNGPQSGLSLLSQPLLPVLPSQRPALLARIAASVKSFFASAPLVTTEGGVAGSATPALSGYTRQQQTWDRRRVLADLWQLYQSDARFRAAVEKHVHKATQGGFSLKIEPRPGTAPRLATRAQGEADAMLRRVGLTLADGSPNAALLAKFLRHGRMEADLFLQHVIAWEKDALGGDTGSGDVVKLKVMPCAGMERLTDDADEFLDPARAFVQIDLSTQQVVPGGAFAAYQIGHHRWKQIGEDRYGQFEYAAARDSFRSLENLEKFQEVRRKSNASRIEEHTLGLPEGGTTAQDITDYQEAISTLPDGAAVSSDPYQQMGKYVHDGNVTIKVHASDPTVHEIADLFYFLDKEAAGVGVPFQLLGMNLAGVPRDTLGLIVDEWLDGMAYDIQWVYNVILEVICLQLQLRGLSPDAFTISLATPNRAFDSAEDAIAFVTKCMTNTLGAGMNAKPFPLLTAETAVQMLSEYIGIPDAKGYVTKLEAMMTEKHMDADTVHEMQMMGADPGVQTGATNSKTTSGTTGYGKKLENGKVKAGSADKTKGGDAYKKVK